MPTIEWRPSWWFKPTVELDRRGTRIRWSFTRPGRRVSRSIRAARQRANWPSSASRSGLSGQVSAYRPGRQRADVLSDFLRLAEPKADARDVLALCRKWGVLRVNEETTRSTFGSRAKTGEGWDPVSLYFAIAGELAEVLKLARGAGSSGRARQAAQEAATLALRAHAGSVGVEATWSFDRGVQLDLGGGGLRAALFSELVHRLDALARLYKCAGCGREERRSRRPPAGGRSYCARCRNTGEPMRQARAAYRARIRQGT